MSIPNQSDITSSFIHAIQAGTYPDNENVASAHLSTQSVPSILEALRNARTQVQDEIKRTSRAEASGVDGWIKQAEQLQIDIEHSKAVAHEIVKEAQHLASLHEARQDVATKLDLLAIEVEFNNRLKQTLQQIKRTTETLAAGQDAAARYDLLAAQSNYENATAALDDLRPSAQTLVFDLLEQRHAKLHTTILQQLDQRWHSLLHVDTQASKITLDTANKANISELATTVDLMMRLNVFDAKALSFCRDLDRNIIKPRLRHFAKNQALQLIVNDTSLQVGDPAPDHGAIAILDDLAAMLGFLHSKLPIAVSVRISESLMPNIISSLINTWLSASIVTSLNDLPQYEHVLENVRKFASILKALDFQGDIDLLEWVEDAPRIWLAKRREVALVAVRDAISRGIRSTRLVERVETQVLAHDDEMLSDEHTSQTEQKIDRVGDQKSQDSVDTSNPSSADEDDDLSAWDQAFDEPSGTPKAEDESHNGNEDEAWDWEEPDQSAKISDNVASPDLLPKVNGHNNEDQPAERELTLRETYTVTYIPETILEIITEIVSDAQNLDKPPYSSSSVAAAAIGLYSIPKLALAGFRALAPQYYSPIEGGNMYLYNDCVRIVSELDEFIARQSALDSTSELRKSAWPSTRMRLDEATGALTSFGGRAYSKEMESQRTILRDLLDGAQGFVNCTEVPFAQECDNAIAMASDRLREVNKQWIPILSRSALLQSLGSLLGTVLDTLIVEICDLPDISESESIRLKHFCDELTKLGDLFIQESPVGEKTDMTGIYASNWFKFQYLSEIMESSLADIKYLWNEGELKLEFEADEVVDLITALFAESEHRRKAIAEIRRT